MFISRHGRLIASAVLVVALGAVPLLADQGEVLAAGTDCGVTASFHVTLLVRATGSDHYEGASSNITNQIGNVCSIGDTSRNNLSAGYSMLTDETNYIQSGFMNWYSSGGSYFFAEMWDNGTFARKVSTNPISGEQTNHYWEEWRNVTGCVGCVEGLVNGDKYIQTVDNPRSTWGTMEDQFSGEVHHFTSDVPGYSTDETHLSLIQPQLHDSTFTNTLDSTSFTDDSTRWSHSSVTSGNGNGNEWYFWTSSP